MAKRRDFMSELMNEPIRLNGCPQIIVTRSFAWGFFKKLGFPECNGKFNSAEYMAMRQKPVDEPLTDLSTPWVVNVLARMEVDCAQ